MAGEIIEEPIEEPPVEAVAVAVDDIATFKTYEVRDKGGKVVYQYSYPKPLDLQGFEGFTHVELMPEPVVLEPPEELVEIRLRASERDRLLALVQAQAGTSGELAAALASALPVKG